MIFKFQKGKFPEQEWNSLNLTLRMFARRTGEKISQSVEYLSDESVRAEVVIGPKTNDLMNKMASVEDIVAALGGVKIKTARAYIEIPQEKYQDKLVSGIFGYGFYCAQANSTDGQGCEFPLVHMNAESMSDGMVRIFIEVEDVLNVREIGIFASRCGGRVVIENS